MAAYMTTILILSFITINVQCQTFQYSHGWTNGKRASTGVTFQLSPPDLWVKHLNSTQYNAPMRCNMQRMKLLFQANAKEAAYVIPCEVSSSRRNP